VNKKKILDNRKEPMNKIKTNIQPAFSPKADLSSSQGLIVEPETKDVIKTIFIILLNIWCISVIFLFFIYLKKKLLILFYLL